MSRYISKNKRKKNRSIRLSKKKSVRYSQKKHLNLRSDLKKSSQFKKIRSKSKNKNIRRQSKSRTKNLKNDGADNPGRFSIKSESNINKTILKQLEDINQYAKLKYNFDIDFTTEKEFKDLKKEQNLSFLKIKLNDYIKLVKNSILYPKKELDDFKQKYLKKLLKIKEEIDDILYLPTYKKKIIKRKVDIIPTIEEGECIPFLSRQSSYEDQPYKVFDTFQKHKHKTDPNKTRVILKNIDNTYIDIVEA